MTITKERLEQYAFDDRMCNINDEIREMARMALAGVEAVPAACPKCNDTGMADSGGVQPWGEPISVPCDCTAQPALAVDVDDNFYSWFGREWHEHYQQNQYTTSAKQMLGVMAESAWKAGRRAAMLQGAEPVTTACKLPSREHFISLCNKFWNWQEADEINAGEEEPRLEWNGSEFTHRVTQALWRIYQASPGNSPVIPDGWVTVPVEPTESMCDVSHIGVDVHTGVATDDEYYSVSGKHAAKIYRAMLAAAPQREAE